MSLISRKLLDILREKNKRKRKQIKSSINHLKIIEEQDSKGSKKLSSPFLEHQSNSFSLIRRRSTTNFNSTTATSSWEIKYMQRARDATQKKEQNYFFGRRLWEKNCLLFQLFRRPDLTRRKNVANSVVPFLCLLNIQKFL